MEEKRFRTIYGFRGTYGFLNPAYPCEIVWGGVKYPSLLHCFCGCRFKSREVALACASTSDTKELYGIIDTVRKGETLVENFPTREKEILLKIVKERFKKEEELNKLLETEDTRLIFTSACNVLGTSRKGKGLNLLGECYMIYREEIRTSLVRMEEVCNDCTRKVK